MGIGGEKPYVFKPARRVFAGRGRSLLTFGEWRLALLSMMFGGAVAVVWGAGEGVPLDRIALTQPPAELSGPEPDQPVPAVSPAAGLVDASVHVVAESPRHFIARLAEILDEQSFLLDGFETPFVLSGKDQVAAQKLASVKGDELLSCESVGAGTGERIFARCFLETGKEIDSIRADVLSSPDSIAFDSIEGE